LCIYLFIVHICIKLLNTGCVFMHEMLIFWQYLDVSTLINWWPYHLNMIFSC
jgi:hypothetical protein